MPRITTVTSKGQVTIPKEVRDKLGLEAGDRVEIVAEDGVARVRKYGLRLRDVLGSVPAIPIPIEEMPAIAKEERAKQWLKKNH
jgi:AbrB family looped-hinge helix DNA binding protein